MKNIIITGCGRSGTSTVAGLFSASGYYMGDDVMPANDGNPKGYFESRVVNEINEGILERAVPKLSKLRQFAYDSSNRTPRVIRNMLRSHIPMIGRRQLWLSTLSTEFELKATPTEDLQIQTVLSQHPFCLKDPRFSYTIPAWLPRISLEETQFVCVFRSPAETVASIQKECKTRSYLENMRLSKLRALDVWKCMYRQILDKHSKRGNWTFIHMHQLFEQDQLKLLSQITGAKIDVSFPEQSLLRSMGRLKLDRDSNNVFSELCRRAKFEPT